MAASAVASHHYLHTSAEIRDIAGRVAVAGRWRRVGAVEHLSGVLVGDDRDVHSVLAEWDDGARGRERRVCEARRIVIDAVMGSKPHNQAVGDALAGWKGWSRPEQNSDRRLMEPHGGRQLSRYHNRQMPRVGLSQVVRARGTSMVPETGMDMSTADAEAYPGSGPSWWK